MDTSMSLKKLWIDGTVDEDNEGDGLIFISYFAGLSLEKL